MTNERQTHSTVIDLSALHDRSAEFVGPFKIRRVPNHSAKKKESSAPAGADDLAKTGKIHELSDDDLTEVAGGKVHVQDLSITKWVDRTSPKLFIN
jgi:hypothetical protein